MAICSLPAPKDLLYIILMKISETLNHMHPLEREIMFLKATRGSMLIEGYKQSADDLGAMIKECQKKLKKEMTKGRLLHK